MEEFTDNQEVNAASLNRIAIDLGVPTFANFADDTTYNIDKLNEITSAIVSAGIAINDGNACKCTLSDGTITIDSGLIFFATGAKMRIENSLSLTYETSSDIKYVYAQNDFSLNTIKIVLDDEPPVESSDIVMLCTVKNGALTDARTFARAKVSVPTNHEPFRYQQTAYVTSGKTNTVGIVDNGQDYTIAAVYDSYYRRYLTVFLSEGEDVTTSCGLYTTCHLLKNGTSVTISATAGGSGTSTNNFDVWFY